jgi:hypothetical protein
MMGRIAKKYEWSGAAVADKGGITLTTEDAQILIH